MLIHQPRSALLGGAVEVVEVVDLSAYGVQQGRKLSPGSWYWQRRGNLGRKAIFCFFYVILAHGERGPVQVESKYDKHGLFDGNANFAALARIGYQPR